MNLPDAPRILYSRFRLAVRLDRPCSIQRADMVSRRLFIHWVSISIDSSFNHFPRKQKHFR